MSSRASRKNDVGYIGFNEKGEQQCLHCWGWKFPVIHSCPGCPQPGRTPPPKHLVVVAFGGVPEPTKEDRDAH